jgi:hypothetical protein
MLGLQMWVPASLQNSASFQFNRVPMEECIFRLLEAHYVAHESNPSSVGDKITFQVLTPNCRAAPIAEFIAASRTMVNRKHLVPSIARKEEKGGLLTSFQMFSTGELQQDEPDEL